MFLLNSWFICNPYYKNLLNSLGQTGSRFLDIKRQIFGRRFLIHRFSLAGVYCIWFASNIVRRNSLLYPTLIILTIVFFLGSPNIWWWLGCSPVEIHRNARDNTNQNAGLSVEIYIRGEFCLRLPTFKAASCRSVSFSEHLEQANGEAGASAINWSPRHWQITIFCSISPNNCFIIRSPSLFFKCDFTQERSQEGEKRDLIYSWAEFNTQPNTIEWLCAWADHYL